MTFCSCNLFRLTFIILNSTQGDLFVAELSTGNALMVVFVADLFVRVTCLWLKSLQDDLFVAELSSC